MAKDVLEIDAITGETLTRDFTPEEKKEREQAQVAMERERQEIEERRQAALAKLAALGLTRDDLAALGF